MLTWSKVWMEKNREIEFLDSLSAFLSLCDRRSQTQWDVIDTQDGVLVFSESSKNSASQALENWPGTKKQEKTKYLNFIAEKLNFLWEHAQQEWPKWTIEPVYIKANWMEMLEERKVCEKNRDWILIEFRHFSFFSDYDWKEFQRKKIWLFFLPRKVYRMPFKHGEMWPALFPLIANSYLPLLSGFLVTYTYIFYPRLSHIYIHTYEMTVWREAMFMEKITGSYGRFQGWAQIFVLWLKFWKGWLLIF